MTSIPNYSCPRTRQNTSESRLQIHSWLATTKLTNKLTRKKNVFIAKQSRASYSLLFRSYISRSVYTVLYHWISRAGQHAVDKVRVKFQIAESLKFHLIGPMLPFPTGKLRRRNKAVADFYKLEKQKIKVSSKLGGPKKCQAFAIAASGSRDFVFPSQIQPLAIYRKNVCQWWSRYWRNVVE